MWADSGADALATVPLFARLSDDHVRAIARLATIEEIPKGAEIVHVGDPGNCFYLVLEGTAVVHLAGRPDVELGVGDYFGELALLDDSPRSGTVEATEAMRVARIGRTSFLTVLEREPSVALGLLRTMAGQLRASESRAIH